MTDPFKIVIPARYQSTRFPGKPLVAIAGKPMLAHTYQIALASTAGEVIVATDDERIGSYCESEQIPCKMTSVEHQSGTDRVAEVARVSGWGDDDIVVCLQADEPATPPVIIDQVAANLRAHPAASIATLCAPITEYKEFVNPDRVKVVFDTNGYALYFSRAPIPHRRDAIAGSESPAAFVHIGMYAYRCGFLRHYMELEPHVYEQEEKLEQLRALGNGYRIHVDVAKDVPAHGVDRPEDVAFIEQVLLSR